MTESLDQRVARLEQRVDRLVQLTERLAAQCVALAEPQIDAERARILAELPDVFAAWSRSRRENMSDLAERIRRCVRGQAPELPERLQESAAAARRVAARVER